MRTGISIGCALILSAACSAGPEHVERDFGSSVRQMVAGQISDPEAAADPSASHPDMLDGVSAGESLTGYREGAKRGGERRREIPLSIEQ